MYSAIDVVSPRPLDEGPPARLIFDLIGLHRRLDVLVLAGSGERREGPVDADDALGEGFGRRPIEIGVVLDTVASGESLATERDDQVIAFLALLGAEPIGGLDGEDAIAEANLLVLDGEPVGNGRPDGRTVAFDPLNQRGPFVLLHARGFDAHR